MLDAAIWIGVALAGLVLLGLLERARSSPFIRVNGGAIKAAMPMAALCLLGFIAGSIAMLFFFLFFLIDIWLDALVIGALAYAFLFYRIRNNWSEFAGVRLPGRIEPERELPPGLFPQMGVVALQAAGAMVVMFLMLPLLTGAFLLYRFVSHTAGPVIAILLLTVAAPGALFVYLYTRRPPPDAGGSE